MRHIPCPASVRKQRIARGPDGSICVGNDDSIAAGPGPRAKGYGTRKCAANQQISNLGPANGSRPTRLRKRKDPNRCNLAEQACVTRDDMLYPTRFCGAVDRNDRDSLHAGSFCDFPSSFRISLCPLTGRRGQARSFRATDQNSPQSITQKTPNRAWQAQFFLSTENLPMPKRAFELVRR